jgi:tetratricopeptide (TPR) repeat protein
LPLGAPASAQVLSAAERTPLEAQEQTLFEQMLRNPADLDATLAYADVAARLGDNEAAVTALERLLLFNPNLPRVDLELGTLYFRMGSLELARTYFEKAMTANPPPDVAARAQQYMGDVANEASPGRLTGYAFFGTQYQSDANVAPGSPLIHSPVGDVLLTNQFVKRSDQNIFGSAAALYSYDLGTQNRDTIEVLGTGFANHYFEVDRFDLAFAEATVGPRFNLPEPISGVTASSIKPYLIANNVILAGNQYFFTYGAGVEGRALLVDDLLLKGIFEFREKTYSNSNNVSATGLNGDDKLVSLQLTKPVPFMRDSELSVEFDYLDQSTHFTYFSNKTYGGVAAYRIHYDDPTRYSTLPWETALFGSWIQSNYASPDPCCNTSGNPAVFSPSTRFDNHWRFGINQIIPITNSVDFVAQFQRDIVSSNLPLYAYTSNSVLGGLKIRF